MNARFPATFAAGDTLSFDVAGADYPATTWALKYRLIPRVAGTAITLTATEVGDGYVVTATAAVTALWAAGAYAYEAWVEKTGSRTVVASGQTTITADPSTIAAGTDTRSQAQKAVDDCLAALADIAATAESGVSAGTRLTKRYVIAGREMEFEGTTDQIASQLQGQGLLTFWRGELAHENAAKNAAMGLADRRRIYLQARRV